MACGTSSSGARLTFKDLAFSAVLPDGTKRRILEPCSGSFGPSELVAVMGPSGSGKSTLLDMLAMKKTASYTGEVCVNGHVRDRDLFTRIAAYVGQDDCMPAHWKVREALAFNASLKRRPPPTGSKRGAAAELVGELMTAFGLTAVADTYIGGPQVRGISGGQRRRVALARAVAAQVSILFCDEPTSGLSATDAEACILALHTVAKRQQVLVIVNIHQPRREVAELFDTLILLTSSPGRMVYFGPMSETSTYLGRCGHRVPEGANAADYYLDLVTPGSALDASDDLVAEFAKHQYPCIQSAVEKSCSEKGETAMQMLQVASAVHGGDSSAARSGKYVVSFNVQLRTLLQRRARLYFRNPLNIGLQFSGPIFIGFVIGVMFQGIGHHDFGMGTMQFYFILLVMLSLACLPSMSVFIEERRYLKYETCEKLYPESVHVLTILFVSVPMSLLAALIECLVICSFAALPFEVVPTVVWWSLVAFSMFDALFGCLAAVAADGEQAQVMATPFLLIFMLFNGVVVAPATCPPALTWIFKISPTFYALQAIILKATDGTAAQTLYMQQLGYEHGQDTQGMLVVFGAAVVLRVLQVVALKRLNNLKR